MIEELNDFVAQEIYALQREGTLLSPGTYKIKAVWQCHNGHQWSSFWKAVVYNDTWCPHCSSFKTEAKVRTLLENKLNFPLLKKRFYYDKTNKRKFYEFDGYNEEHKLAFEYQGYQHYTYPNHWHKTTEEFIAQKERDKNKKLFCNTMGITLLVIPYTYDLSLLV